MAPGVVAAWVDVMPASLSGGCRMRGEHRGNVPNVQRVPWCEKTFDGRRRLRAPVLTALAAKVPKMGGKNKTLNKILMMPAKKFGSDTAVGNENNKKIIIIGYFSRQRKVTVNKISREKEGARK